MKLKKVSAVIMLVVFAFCLSGCSSGKAFTRAGVVGVAKDHGMAKIENNGDINRLISTFNNCEVSSYYVAQDLTDAQMIYDRYLNASAEYPINVVDDVVLIITTDKRLKGTDSAANIQEDRGMLVLITLNSEASAEKLYEILVKDQLSDTTPTRGKKNGYSYSVDYSYVDNGKNKRGIYLRGKSILAIDGFSFGNGDYFGDYVYRELGIQDPGEV